MSTPIAALRARLLRLGGLPLLLLFAACDVTEPPDSEGVSSEGGLLDAFAAGPPFDGPFEGEALPSGGSEQGGDLVCNGAYGAITVDNVIVPDNARCRLDGTRVDGNVFVYTGAVLVARGIDVGGNIQADGHAGVLVRDLSGQRTFVNGDVQIDQGGPAGVGLTTIGGNLQMGQNDGRLLIAYNAIDSNLQVNQNTGGVRIVRNVIAESMQCQANAPPPAGFGNQAGDKEGQCASL